MSVYLFKAHYHDAAVHVNVTPIATLWRHRCCLAPPPWRLIESITTLWKGDENPIRVSIICNPRRGLPSRGCGKSWTRGWDSFVPSTMWWLIIFLPRPFQRRFSCTKHSAMASLPTTTSCYWLRRDVIIYLALNDGAKMLSHPRVRHHRMRQHLSRHAKFGYRSVSSGRMTCPFPGIFGTVLSTVRENISQDVQILGTNLSSVGEHSILFMAGAAGQAGDAGSSRAPSLTSGLQGSVNVHHGALLLVPQWQCISSFVFYIFVTLVPFAVWSW